jgi:hypothetical protein
MGSAENFKVLHDIWSETQNHFEWREIEGRKMKEKPAQEYSRAGFVINPGDFLLSHAVSRAVPSAPAGLTSVFGMGTGVTLPTKSPENFSKSNSDC